MLNTTRVYAEWTVSGISYRPALNVLTFVAGDHADDYAGPSGSHAESFTDAARDLAAYLRSQEG